MYPIIRRNLDELSGAPIIIESEHHKVHEGHTFQCSYKTPDASPLTDNNSLVFYWITGNRYVHLTGSVAVGGDAEILMYEGTTVSSPGAIVPIYNMRRDGIMTPGTRVYRGPTITVAGTILHNSFEPGGVGPQAGGTVARSFTEWILKINTAYALQAINRSGNSQPASIVLQFYETEVP